MEIMAPGTLPCSACSSDAAGALLISLLLTCTTGVVALRRSSVVDWPVPTTASSLKGSSSSATVTVDVVDGTGTTFRAKPIARTNSRTSPGPTAMRNEPSAPDCATPRPFSSTIVAPATGASPNARATRPVISRLCAAATAGKPRTRSADANVQARLMPCLPFLDGYLRTVHRTADQTGEYACRFRTPQPRSFQWDGLFFWTPRLVQTRMTPQVAERRWYCGGALIRFE